jgi:hypothetical protein
MLRCVCPSDTESHNKTPDNTNTSKTLLHFHTQSVECLAWLADPHRTSKDPRKKWLVVKKKAFVVKKVGKKLGQVSAVDSE